MDNCRAFSCELYILQQYYTHVQCTWYNVYISEICIIYLLYIIHTEDI